MSYRKKTQIIQYGLLYVMLLIPGSCAVSRYLNTTILYGVVCGAYFLLLLFSKKYRDAYIPWFCVLLLLATITIRAKTNGVGPLSFLENISMLIITYIAIAFDKQWFLTRFVKIVSVFAVISIVFWAVFCIFPSLVDLWPATTFWTQNLGTGQWATVLHGKGLWFYSYLEIHATRNCGFYTEPGVYQIVLNAALFILLFWKDKLRLKNEKQYRTLVSIIFITLITCQSTTGYIAMIVILACFFCMHSRESNALGFKANLLLLLVVAGAAVLIDYVIRGTDSILYIQVINKIFGGTASGINISDSTGQYRMETVQASFQALSEDLFGIGFDRFNTIRDNIDPAAVAASIATYAAVYGIVFWLLMMVTIFLPVFMRMKKPLLILIFIFMFVNSTVSETYLFYPGLMLFPIYLTTRNTVVSFPQQIMTGKLKTFSVSRNMEGVTQ